MTMKRHAGLLASTVAAVALGASVASAGEIVWWTPNWSQARAEEMAKKFMEANPDITVKMEITVSDGLPTRIQTALRSGSPPDVIEAQHGWVVPYAQSDLILPLDDIVAALGKEDFVPAALGYDTWDGHIWGIPFRIETHGVFYNKGMYEAAGLDPENPPQTWDELVEAGMALSKDGQYGFAITGGGEFGNTIFRSLPFIWMNGGAIINDEGTEVLVNSPETVEAVTFYTDFLKKGISPPSTLQNDGAANRRLFIAETVATYQSGQFDVNSIRQENPDIDIGVMMIPHPEGKDTAAILGGWSFIIPKDAPNVEDAKKFVEFMGQADNMGFFTDTFPARVSAMEMERFQDPILDTFKKMLPFGRTLPQHKNWIPITQAYFNGVQSILVGDAEPQEAMDIAAEEIQVLLDQ